MLDTMADMDLNDANIKIDRQYYISTVTYIDETALRGMGDVPDDREIWVERPGVCDDKVDSNYLVKHYPQHLRQYFTVPRHINNSLRKCQLCTERDKE